MAVKKSLRIDIAGKPTYFIDRLANDIVDMSQGGVSRVQVKTDYNVKTFVGYPFWIEQ